LIYAGFGIYMQMENNRQAARALMFSSFFYLPLVLIIFFIASL